MVIVTLFENVFASTKVIFISSCINRLLVNEALRKTVTTHRSVCFSMIIASFGGRWYWTFDNFKIMHYAKNEVFH